MNDRLAFERMFRAHSSAVLRYAIRRVGADGAHDAVAETFLVAWRRQREIPSDPLPWLYAVARRVCANQLRGRERQTALHAKIAAEPAYPPALEPGSQFEPVLAALARLRESDRETLLLIGWEGLSYAQAAAALGCSTPTFAVRAHRARTRLARELADRANDTTEAENDADGGLAHEVA